MRQFLITLITILTLAASAFAYGEDPGIPDTVKIEGDTLYLGRSAPVYITIVNDQDILEAMMAFAYALEGPGFAQFDSLVFVGRMEDPSIMPNRIVNTYNMDDVPPDTLCTAWLASGVSNELPPGNSPVAAIYMTGLELGLMTIDSCGYPPSNDFAFVLDWAGGEDSIFVPHVEPSMILVHDGLFPPLIQVPDELPVLVAGDLCQFEVSGSSPGGSPVVIDLVSFEPLDDTTGIPANAPVLSGDSIVIFSWDTELSDISIWQALFRVCDTAGMCDTGAVTIQLVESSIFVVDFDITEIEGFPISTGMVAGDFDADMYPELLTTGSGEQYTPTLVVYDRQPGTPYSSVFVIDDGCTKMEPRLFYFDGDDFPDVVLSGWGETTDEWIQVMCGVGDNSFGLTTDDPASAMARTSVLSELNGDQYLDYVISGHIGVYVYAGRFNGFTQIGHFAESDTIVSAVCLELNEDGYSDLILGTPHGVGIWTNDGNAEFTQVDFFPQEFGAADMDLTTQGSDFNSDGYPDLCVAAPSVGGEWSNLMLFLGNGAGSFNQSVIKSVRGQAFANCPGDYNNDRDLDIVYINGSDQYLGILFGNGDGTFTNEMRIWLPRYYPVELTATDIDLDCDLDLLVASQEIVEGAVLYQLMNQSDPGDCQLRPLSVSGRDNADMRLVSPTARVLSKVENSTPGGQYYLRDMDGNQLIDDGMSMNATEFGAYILSVFPKANQPEQTEFSVIFETDGQLFRLVENQPMVAQGYEFVICPTGDCPVSPTPGRFIGNNPPTFSWEYMDEVDFELADDLAFANVLVLATIDGNSFTPVSPLAVTDTALYYWRVTPTGSRDPGDIYPINILADCCIGTRGNVDGDQGDNVNIADLTFLVAYLFAGGLEPSCPDEANVNSAPEGTINIADLTFLVAYLFGGGSAPANCP